MIVVFGNYQQARMLAKEREIPLREIVTAHANPERLQGYIGRIEVLIAGDYERTSDTAQIEEIIRIINYMADLREKAETESSETNV
jgi:hypothetical protein